MRRTIAVMVVVAALALVAVSCRKSPEAVYQQTLRTVQELMSQGESGKAVGVLRALFDNKTFEAYRPPLLGAMMYCHLSTGRVEAAQALFKEVAGREAALAATSMGMIENHLWGTGRFDDLAAWCEQLQAYAFAAPVMAGIAQRHCQALEAAGKGAAVPGVVAVYLGKLDEGTALAWVQPLFGAMLAGGRAEDAKAVRAAVEKALKTSPAVIGALAGMDVDLLLATKGPAAAGEHLRQVLARIPDDSAIRNLNTVAGAMAKGRDVDASDALALAVFEGAANRRPVREASASVWVNNAAEGRKDMTELSKRLVALKDMGLAPEFILDKTDSVYGPLLSGGKKEDFASLFAVLDAFRAAAQDKGIRQRLTAMLLDLSFFLERFEDALKLLEGPDVGGAEEQRPMMICKVKGHLALQKGQTQEAVDRFREFMGYIAKGNDFEFDPVGGTRVSKEMILGLNAKRIGDVLAGAGKAAEAAKAYAEARDYYTKALGQFPDEASKERATVKKQMAEVPGS